MHPLRRITLGFVLFSVLGALIWGAVMVVRLAPIGTAYTAKTLCSGVFVSGRMAQSVIAEDILAENHPLLQLVTPQLDAKRRRASATFLGFAERVAQFRNGLGCTLALGVEPESLAQVDGALPALQPAELLPTGPLPGRADPSRVAALLDKAFASPRAHTRAVAVLYDGHVIAERYAPGFSAVTPMPGWSMTKTATAVLAGMLLGRGQLSLEQGNLLREWAEPGDARAAISVEQLLHMTDGLYFDERTGDPLSDVVQMLLTTGDASGFAAAKPLRTAPGAKWRYASGTTNVLMRVLRRQSRLPPDAFARLPREALFEPLGMHSATIETDATNLPVGSSFMWASAHDWLRFGQFLMQDGVWQGERLLPQGWVPFMRKVVPQAPQHNFGGHLWLQIPEPYNGRAPGASPLPADAFHLVGHEGQLLSVIPSRRLVVLRLGITRERFAWDHQAFLAQLLAALD